MKALPIANFQLSIEQVASGTSEIESAIDNWQAEMISWKH